jgi:signal transduction histidine kinase
MTEVSAQSGGGSKLSPRRGDRGVRTRALLMLATAGIVAGTTLVSLFAIRQPLRGLMVRNASADLENSVATFDKLQSQRILALDRENSLIADIPTLKALMTTSDQPTIENGAVEFLSGNDLFVLADRDRRIVAAYVSGRQAPPAVRDDLQAFVNAAPASYLVSGATLFGCSIRPIYFGSAKEGTVLGYVVSGFAVDRRVVEDLRKATGVEATFFSGGHLLASSLRPDLERQLSTLALPEPNTQPGPFNIVLGGEKYLATEHQLPSNSAPIRLVELKSLGQEERSIRQIDRIVLSAGLLSLLLGTVLMVTLSRAVTRPLEDLAAGVRAFAEGDSVHILPYRGTREVRELSTAFAGMRREILSANQALLEAERLATIGRMASSVSHDLRHYLAAVYANAEFLASGKLSEPDRNEVLGEIRSAVNGTTELLESLLIFSRTGPGARRSHEFVSALTDRAVGMIRSHPDSAAVALSVIHADPAQTAAMVDGKQIERAIYNLLLNACQAPRSNGVSPSVSIAFEAREKELSIDVKDNGDGVPANIRDILFEPFVSEGKQKGSGLGLTLTQTIAAEHGGNVTLISSRPGETIFRMSISRGAEFTSTLTSSRTPMESL